MHKTTAVRHGNLNSEGVDSVIGDTHSQYGWTPRQGNETRQDSETGQDSETRQDNGTRQDSETTQ